MYISIILLSSCLCVITALTYDMENQGITSMLNYSIPENTEEFRFARNSITYVPAGYFQNLSLLDDINLRSNLISNIDDFAFAGVPSVTRIELGSNQLSVIGKSMFLGLPNLYDLDLHFN